MRAYDAATGSGSVLLDDGTALDFDAAALAGSGLRLLRVGQRVRLETEPVPPPVAGTPGVGRRVRRLTLATLPWS